MTTTTDRDDELAARIELSRLAENHGHRKVNQLVEYFGAHRAAQILIEPANFEELFREFIATGRTDSQLDRSVNGFSIWAARRPSSYVADTPTGVHVVIPGDEHWPAALDDLGDEKPLVLWVRGDVSLLATKSLAIVGARAATGYGEHVTMEISAHVADAGITVLSGAAYGIDGMAHRAALASRGKTVAVLAGGVDRAYPAGHTALVDRIAEQGALVSESLPGSAPTRQRFIARARLIAALSGAVLVTEAGARSGSLAAAHSAVQLGRPVGAVSGPVTSAASTGSNLLIRDRTGILVNNGTEALELLRRDLTEGESE